MTSGNFTAFPIDNILKNDRQRKELTDIPSLAKSLAERGQINPILIQRDGTLIAGERRLEAARSLGWTHITVHFADEVPPHELEALELEENTRRVDLSWQDQCLAVERYHKLRAQHEAGWTLEKTAEALNIDFRTVHDKMNVAAELLTGNEDVASAERFSIARNAVRRRRQRATQELVKSLTVEGKDDEAEAVEADTPPLLHGDFREILTTWDGPLFNLLHCDFPYGINFHAHDAMSKGTTERYYDSPEYFRELVASLDDLPIAESAHMVFWYSLNWHVYLLSELTKLGWKVNPYPLIWGKSDNSGILPDANRGPRRNYETALLCSRSDRFIVKPVANIWWGARGEAAHTSMKPKPMLEHFLRMLVDESTVMLDPTCGSGNAVRVAKDLGAHTVLGIEQNETYWKDAVANWNAE